MPKMLPTTAIGDYNRATLSAAEEITAEVERLCRGLTPPATLSGRMVAGEPISDGGNSPRIKLLVIGNPIPNTSHQYPNTRPVVALVGNGTLADQNRTKLTLRSGEPYGEFAKRICRQLASMLTEARQMLQLEAETTRRREAGWRLVRECINANPSLDARSDVSVIPSTSGPVGFATFGFDNVEEFNALLKAWDEVRGVKA